MKNSVKNNITFCILVDDNWNVKILSLELGQTSKPISFADFT